MKTRLMMCFVALALLAFSLHQATRDQLFNWVVAALMALAAIGVLRGVRWGRRMALVFMWLLLLAAIGDVLPARIEADQALGAPAATPGELWTELIVLSAVALASLHILATCESRFRAEWW